MKKRTVDDRSRVHAITAGSSLVTVLQDAIVRSEAYRAQEHNLDARLIVEGEYYCWTHGS